MTQKHRNDNNSPPKSRVLVVPSSFTSSFNNNKRPRPSGWVLGWHSRTDSRETTVVASFLPPGISLNVYQDRISQWQRQQQQVAQEEKSKVEECTCLTDSLQIVAFWEENTNNNSNIHSTTAAASDNDVTTTTTTKAGLPILNAQCGYPWWKEGDTIASANRQQQQLYNQLLFYSLEEVECSHFCSGIGADTEWALVLHRINHSQAVATAVASGIIPHQPPPPPILECNQAPFSSDDVSSQSILEKIQHLLFDNSLTFLHIRHWYYSYSASSSSWQNCVPLVHQCERCHKQCRIPQKSKVTRLRAARTHANLSFGLDRLLGLVVAASLVYLLGNDTHVGTVYLRMKIGAFEALQAQISWLETFPVGFKLNVPLTHNMGHEIRNLLHHQDQFLSATVWNATFCHTYGLPLLVAVAVFGGWTAFLAVVIDVWRLENLHLLIMAFCFRKLYQAELYLLSALFRLFRGKKRNILRQRTDSMEYDAMQLLVGTVAFCICVFLWTTLLVYYTFFMLWNFGMNLPVLAVWVLYATSRTFPWGTVWYRLRYPAWFPRDLYLLDLPVKDATTSDVQVTAVRSIYQSTASILSNHIAAPLRSIAQWCLQSCLEVLYPHSGNLSPVSLPLEELMKEINA